jgi:hypothetical protein
MSTWPDEGVIQIFDKDDARIALFSLAFLRIGGVKTWDYIDFATQSVVRDAGIIVPMETHLGRSPTPTIGSYRFLREDKSEEAVRMRVGPRFQYKRRGPSSSGEHSDTMSNSSRRSANQDHFRFQLAIRDGFCLVTDRKKAVAAHILPLSRPEYYTEVLGYDPGYLYDVSYGLFLSRDLHHAFDRGEWGLYPKPGCADTLIVHVFYTEDPTDELKEFHGKEITQQRFRIHSVRELPDRNLLAFHYQQCLIKHVRLFSFYPHAETSEAT